MEKIVVDKKNNLERIDKYLSNVTTHSRSTIQSLIKDEYILVNNDSVKANYKVKTSDEITITMPKPVNTDLIPQDIPLDIVYEDEYLVVVNKPVGMVVHPGAGNWQNTMVNALLYHIDDLKAIKGEIRPGIVHRIDKETSGLLMVAKDNETLEDLSNQLKEKTVTREYIALVEGVIPHNHGKIDAPIGRDPKYRQRNAVIKDGKQAITHFNVLKRYEHHTLIACQLETGRTHQIRVHMAYIDFPIVGDPKYGLRKTDTTNGQFLHAKTLGFIHPHTKEYLEFEADLPAYFQTFLDELEELNNA